MVGYMDRYQKKKKGLLASKISNFGVDRIKQRTHFQHLESSPHPSGKTPFIILLWILRVFAVIPLFFHTIEKRAENPESQNKKVTSSYLYFHLPSIFLSYLCFFTKMGCMMIDHRQIIILEE